MQGEHVGCLPSHRTLRFRHGSQAIAILRRLLVGDFELCKWPTLPFVVIFFREKMLSLVGLPLGGAECMSATSKTSSLQSERSHLA